MSASDFPGVETLSAAEPPFGYSDVKDDEITWMMRQRPLEADLASLTVDYGAEEANRMVDQFTGRGLSTCTPALAWPGVGTRWEAFLEHCTQLQSQHPDKVAPSPKEAFASFAKSLGRVRTFRALALEADSLKNIIDADEIFPSGRLAHTAEALSNVVKEHGVRKIAVARLFIAHLKRLIGMDPSISLHDEWQITSCIASGYCSYPSKPVYLFEVSVPVVESLGWRLIDVAHRSGDILGPRYADHEDWFHFQGVWFDSTRQETERYGLYTVPFLKDRMCSLRKFSTKEALMDSLKPYTLQQQCLYNKSDQAAQGSDQAKKKPANEQH
eukprot:NODE_3380_length_1230_cov_26.087624_g3209_i0.p1 GENE.NODE_3380_length_1230_cov_26.087624_g3209_i0~~NODE_3380_length_1230_cov_26.087624_g3209_i0.p1  ORF type:complete len:346 (+),score=63.92 NODE_3380_length_1230_cov_26.087624_g3209_i0:58-1038(+)